MAVAEVGIVAGRVLGKLRHVQRTDSDRSGFFKPAYGCSRVGGPEGPADLGTACAKLAGPVVYILVRQRHAVQRAEKPPSLAQLVECICLLQGVLPVESDTRVESGCGRETVQRSLGETDRCDLTVADGVAGLDQGQPREVRSAHHFCRHGVRSLISCRATPKLDGSSSNAIWPRKRSKPLAISASPRANSSLAAFGGATPDQNFVCSST